PHPWGGALRLVGWRVSRGRSGRPDAHLGLGEDVAVEEATDLVPGHAGADTAQALVQRVEHEAQLARALVGAWAVVPEVAEVVAAVVAAAVEVEALRQALRERGDGGRQVVDQPV